MMTGRCSGGFSCSGTTANNWLSALFQIGCQAPARPGACDSLSGPGRIPSPLREIMGITRAVRAMREPARAESCRSQVEALLPALLASGEARIEIVAGKLACSRQTLYRRLKAEGATFEEVLDAVRRRLSSRLIKERLPIKEIAYRVGFSDPSAFSRAFKRWTGSSPSKF